ncbi:FtsB family cell division protein [Desulfobacca acetoxidans]
MALPHAKRGSKSPVGGSNPSPMGKISGGRLYWVLLALLGLALGATLLFGNKGLYHLYQLRQERERLFQANLSLKDENERLVKTIDRLQNDREFIEDTIRKELNFIKKNEVIYQLAPEVGSGPKVTQAPALGPPPNPTARSKRTGR